MGQQEFACKHGCGASFSQKTNMYRHMRTSCPKKPAPPTDPAVPEAAPLNAFRREDSSHVVERLDALLRSRDLFAAQRDLLASVHFDPHRPANMTLWPGDFRSAYAAIFDPCSLTWQPVGAHWATRCVLSDTLAILERHMSTHARKFDTATRARFDTFAMNVRMNIRGTMNGIVLDTLRMARDHGDTVLESHPHAGSLRDLLPSMRAMDISPDQQPESFDMRMP